MFLGGLIEQLGDMMMKTIWILILVKRGFIQNPEIFFTEADAEKRKRFILKDFNKDYDEIDVFKKEIKC